MFDVWMGDIELTAAVLIFSVAVLFPVQLLLCFKVRSKVIRLLPVMVLAVPASVFCCNAVLRPGQDGLGYTFLAVFSGFMLLMCGLGWGIWAIAQAVKGKNDL